MFGTRTEPALDINNLASSLLFLEILGFAVDRIYTHMYNLQHVRSSLTVSPNGIAPSGTVYVGSAGFAYMFFHLARHVQHGSLEIPRHVVILRPRGSQKPTTADSTKRNSPVTAEELYRLSLTICDTAITATSQFPGRCTFLEGYAGPLALRCAILSALGRNQVCSTGIA